MLWGRLPWFRYSLNFLPGVAFAYSSWYASRGLVAYVLMDEEAMGLTILLIRPSDSSDL